MNSRPLIILRLATSATEEIGSTRHGKLSIFPVTGGSFDGERLRGKVLAGGGDWVTAQPDGTFELDLRVTLETDDGALIHMTFTGVRDDANHRGDSLTDSRLLADKRPVRTVHLRRFAGRMLAAPFRLLLLAFELTKRQAIFSKSRNESRSIRDSRTSTIG